MLLSKRACQGAVLVEERAVSFITHLYIINEGPQDFSCVILAPKLAQQ